MVKHTWPRGTFALRVVASFSWRPLCPRRYIANALSCCTFLFQSPSVAEAATLPLRRIAWAMSRRSSWFGRCGRWGRSSLARWDIHRMKSLAATAQKVFMPSVKRAIARPRKQQQSGLWFLVVSYCFIFAMFLESLYCF